MRAVVYTEPGDANVLHLVERPMPEPGEGEVRVAVHVSAVNPTDWKSRTGPLAFGVQVPNHDGAGVIDLVGPGVDSARMGERVWLWEAAWQRADGTAQEYVTLPARQAVRLPDAASLELGACLGIPFLTAHRCLTVSEAGPARLGPGSLAGRTVLVAGGAGAVGNAAIQLAVWSGAHVVTTVSSPAKAVLAAAAGAHHVVNYREGDPAEAIKAAAGEGVDIIVEVAPGPNALLDAEVLAPYGVVAMYTRGPDADPTIGLSKLFARNVRWQAVLVYTVPEDAKDAAVSDVSAALAEGAIRVGEDAGLPLHYYPLAGTPAAHAAVESNAIGKVVIMVR